jgi:hypothetical protein
MKTILLIKKISKNYWTTNTNKNKIYFNLNLKVKKLLIKNLQVLFNNFFKQIINYK